jgi:hypothetical protein
MNPLSSTTSTLVGLSLTKSPGDALHLPEDALARVHGREHVSRLAEQGLDFSENEIAAWLQYLMEVRE